MPPISILSFNAKSVMSSWSIIKTEIRNIHPDVVCISETWNSIDDDSDAFCFDDYVSFCDNREGKRSAGEMLLIKASLKPSAVTQQRKIHHP